MKRLSETALEDRPREKLMAYGTGALSDVELLAILLGSGTAERDVLSLASQLVREIDRRNGNLGSDDLCKVKGVGPAKAAVVLAAFEFAKRRIRPEGLRISEAGDVFSLLKHMADRKQEHFVSVSLNGANEVIATRIITVGLVNESQIHAREVFADPIIDRACAVIIAHNHPSGNLEPSKEDIAVTRHIAQAGETLRIPLLDHVIFSRKGYYSFAEQGML